MFYKEDAAFEESVFETVYDGFPELLLPPAKLQ